MNNPNAIYELLLDYANSTAPVEQLNIGLVWTLCRSGSSSGLAMSPGIATRTLPWAGTLTARTLGQLAGWIREWDPHQAAVGMAAINCALNNRPLPQSISLEPLSGAANMTVFDYFLPQLQGKKVAVIGRYPGIERLAAELDLTILELHPQGNDLPAAAAEYVLPEADWVFLTASSIINKTFPRLAELAQSATTVLMGPSTPWLPEFHEFGIDYLAGVEIADAELLQRTVAEGGGVRIFDGAVRYRIAALQTENNTQWLKAQIAAAANEKQRLTTAMDDWYSGNRRERFPEYQELDAVTIRLSRMDTSYKRLWDEQHTKPK